MARLDRLVWAAGASHVAHGVRFGVRVSEAGALADLEARLPPGTRRASGPEVELLFSLIAGGSIRPGLRRFHALYDGSARLARSLELEPVLAAFESAVELSVAARARQVFVHAGAVGIGGGALLLPGTTRSGKSSLVAALVRAGAVYYSDEFAVLDGRGRVHPYARPLSLRDATAGGRARRWPVEELGGIAGARPIPVRWVLVTRYREGTRLRPRLLTPGQAVLALLSNTVSARTQPGRALEVLQRVVSRARAMTGRRGEAGEAASWLMATLGDER